MRGINKNVNKKNYNSYFDDDDTNDDETTDDDDDIRDKLEESLVREVISEVYEKQFREITALGPNIISILVGIHSKETILRLNIYLENGTVGCCCIVNEQVREAFKRNVSTRESLKKALQDPPKLAQIDSESFSTYNDNDDTINVSLLSISRDNNKKNNKNDLITTMKVDGNDMRELTAKIELAEVGVCVIIGERDELLAQIKAIDAKNPNSNTNNNTTNSNELDEYVFEENEEDESENDDEEDVNTLAGLEFDYSLSEDVLLQTEQCLGDIDKMGKTVTSVSTNGKACVFLYGNGGIAYTPNVPRTLYNKLKSLRINPKATRPAYIAIGTRERYHVSFLNGTFDWKGPKGLGQVLKRLRHPPRCVAFGPNYDTFFIVYHDGSWEHQGKSMPQDLIKKLIARSERPDLVCVTLGPKGEWFLRTQNGRLWWGGIKPTLDALIEKLIQKGRYLNFIDFGEEGSYFLSYD